MRILIDIGHPAHVHLFKNFAFEMIKKGNQVFFTLRQKEFSEYLLKKYGFSYIRYGSSYSGVVGKLWGLAKFDAALFKIVKRFKPDITLSHSSFYLAQVSRLLGIKNITLEDTGNMEQIALYKPFANCILSPDCYNRNHGKKHLFYKGYHELAYLHPRNFTPLDNFRKELSLIKEEEYAVLRFSSWGASHDFGHGGLGAKDKMEIINLIEKRMKLFISSEVELPENLKKYKFKISPDQIHNIIANASFVVGEGATMASESSILGIPAIYVSSIDADTINEQEKYGLLFHFRNGKGVIEKVEELLNTPDIKQEWQRRRKKMLADKIDVTAFLVWFVENYPDSKVIMKENPDYQYRFK